MKSPAEVVVGTLRLVGGHELPKPGIGDLSMQPTYMGQDLLNPPSVEGWHTGKEWINSGSLMARVNFVAEKVGDTSLPGVRAIINRLKAHGSLSPEQLVDGCLDLLGPVRGRRRHQAGAGLAKPNSGVRSLGTATANAQDRRPARRRNAATDRRDQRVSIRLTTETHQTRRKLQCQQHRQLKKTR